MSYSVIKKKEQKNVQKSKEVFKLGKTVRLMGIVPPKKKTYYVYTFVVYVDTFVQTI